jgi:hypothetical protein
VYLFHLPELQLFLLYSFDILFPLSTSKRDENINRWKSQHVFPMLKRTVTNLNFIAD